MYYLYTQSHEGNLLRLKRLSAISLAGRKSGIIIKYLTTQLSPQITEPWSWHITVEDLLNVLSLKGNTLVIDLKPNNNYISLYKIKNIWGYSSNGWTPLLFELEGILVENDAIKYDRNDFSIKAYDDDKPIFTVLYVSGTIINGEVIGKWIFPKPSATNSVLLWPEVLEFFAEKMGYKKV